MMTKKVFVPLHFFFITFARLHMILIAELQSRLQDHAFDKKIELTRFKEKKFATNSGFYLQLSKFSYW